MRISDWSSDVCLPICLFSAARPVGADAVHRALDVRPALCGAGAAGDMTDKAPKLLSGGNPQIAKGDGDAPVQAYIAAMPGWKRAAGERLDALIENSVDRKSTRLNSSH